jgi:hypothetical protein
LDLEAVALLTDAEEDAERMGEVHLAQLVHLALVGGGRKLDSLCKQTAHVVFSCFKVVRGLNLSARLMAMAGI